MKFIVENIILFLHKNYILECRMRSIETWELEFGTWIDLQGHHMLMNHVSAHVKSCINQWVVNHMIYRMYMQSIKQ